MNLVIAYNSIISLFFSFYQRILEIKLTHDELNHLDIVMKFLYSLIFELIERFKQNYIEIIFQFLCCYILFSFIIFATIYSVISIYLKGIHNTYQTDTKIIPQTFFELHMNILYFITKWIFYSIIPCIILSILIFKK
jgi:hypothetical protein